MTCGRAESMTSSGEPPKALTPGVPHVSPRPTKFDRDSDDHIVECSGSSKIMEGIHLGAHSTTDVFELTLRTPSTGEYISDDEHGRIVATTLAVALRKALCTQLGISTNEVNYCIRPSILATKESVLVLQLFDAVSGGAGFSSSAPGVIEDVLNKLVEALKCTENCGSACSKCLLEVDSRHDIEKLDRHAALKWLGPDFKQYLKLDENLSRLVEGAKFCSRSIKNQIAEWLNDDVTEVKFVLSSNVDAWDVSLTSIKQKIFSLLEQGLSLSFILPDVNLNTDVQNFLYQIERIGVGLFVSKYNGAAVCQAKTRDGWKTLATKGDEARVPGDQWLESNAASVVSNCAVEIQGSSISFESSRHLEKTVKIEPYQEANGSLSDFGAKLLKEVFKASPAFKLLFESSEVKAISYSDRYMKNPAAIMMFAEFVGALTKGVTADIKAQVHFEDREPKWQPSQLRNDWRWERDFEVFSSAWISLISKGNVDFDIRYNLYDLPHYRVMKIDFSTGDKAEITFDQGFGYWAIDGSLDFSASAEDQVKVLAQLRNKLKVYTKSSHATAMYVRLI
jgi:hypothetical protein